MLRDRLRSTSFQEQEDLLFGSRVGGFRMGRALIMGRSYGKERGGEGRVALVMLPMHA